MSVSSTLVYGTNPEFRKSRKSSNPKSGETISSCSRSVSSPGSGIYDIQIASLCVRGIITPALAPMQPFRAKSIQRNKFLLGTHLLHLGQDKTPCLGADAPNGIQTHKLLITSREHKPLHHSAPIYLSDRIF